MNVSSTWRNQSMYTLQCAHDLCYACTYPAATQKGLADLCLYQLQCACNCMCIHPSIKIFSLRSYRRITNKVVCVCTVSMKIKMTVK